MNGAARVSLRWPAAIVAAILCIAIGAVGTYVATRGGLNTSGGTDTHAVVPAAGARVAATQAPHPVTSAGTTLADVVVPVSPDAAARAGIVVAPVESAPMQGGLRLPAVVEPNAYKRVDVTSLVSGRVTQVLAELGTQVRQGQTLAKVFSPELADAQTRYASARAELEAHERELGRTEKLVGIGAASRQELERIHAEHSAQRTSVESARARLELLGQSREVIEGLAAGTPVAASIEISAPLAGIVTERRANVGMNVDPAAPLFTIVDLSTVWIVANLYEKDFAQVRVGSTATIVTAAYPGLRLSGRVSYIDPQVSPETRTAKVRVEVSNPRHELRLGMLAEAQIDGPEHTSVATIPRAAVQHVADRSVVYVSKSTSPGQFIEREVRLGQASGDRVEVRSGLAAGEQVVTDGSFFLRAERERLGLRPLGRAESSGASPVQGAQAGTATEQTARILVNEQGYEPASVALRSGVPARLTFVRTTDKTCGTEVVFPSLNVKRALPLNQPVDIAFTPAKSGEIAFACGMNMLKGVIVVH